MASRTHEHQSKSFRGNFTGHQSPDIQTTENGTHNQSSIILPEDNDRDTFCTSKPHTIQNVPLPKRSCMKLHTACDGTEHRCFAITHDESHDFPFSSTPPLNMFGASIHYFLQFIPVLPNLHIISRIQAGNPAHYERRGIKDEKEVSVRPTINMSSRSDFR